ncbi:MAG TPA: DEAD/DEAH box helicase [Thermoanaerobaculia bacterium]|nr:DEAD/DEAH box helicase [Thermoanaerobaculia bacterium]
MTFHSVLSRQVAPSVRDRGKTYYDERRVQLHQQSRDFIDATVRGSTTYEIALHRSGSELVVCCSCPYFETESTICKHIWATVLEVSETNLFGSRTPATLRLHRHDEEGAGDHFVDDGDISEEWRDPAATPGASGRWRTVLRNIQSASREQRRTRFIAEDSLEVFYAIAANGDRLHGMSLQILSRSRKKSGDWTRLKPFSIPRLHLSDLPDERDYEILTLLPRPVNPYYVDPAEKTPSSVRLDGSTIEVLLPKLAATGRLVHFVSNDEPGRPIMLDLAEPWSFAVRVGREEAAYRIEGFFKRNGENMALSDPSILLPDGYLITEDRIARFDAEAWSWISLLRTEGTLEIPLRDKDTLIEELSSADSLPQLELPPELTWNEVFAVPRPRLQVTSRGAATNSLRGEVLFDYDGSLIGFDQPRRRIRRGEEILVRDIMAEAAAMRRVTELAGHRRLNGAMSIRRDKLPHLARTLVSEGWVVEAEQGAFRLPGKVRAEMRSGVDWFEMEGGVRYGEQDVALPRLLAAVRRGENFVTLDDGTVGLLPEEWLARMAPLFSLSEVSEGTIRFPAAQAILIDAMLAQQEEVTFDENFRELRSRFAASSELRPIDPPASFQGELRPYQKLGLSWFGFLRDVECGGCLADDMGLGKTVQVLALFDSIRATAGENRPTSLVVAPRSLIFNWMAEAKRFTPQLRVLDHTGMDRTRGNGHFRGYDLVLTTYGTLRRDIRHLAAAHFEYVILDEAQAIKNALSQSAKAARLLQARHRLALSGTPIENHLGELWSLFEFLNPGLLGASTAFRLRGPGAEVGGSESREMLARALRPFILRRTKEHVAPELPPRMEQTLYCELEPEQRKHYEELRSYYRASLMSKVKSDGINKSKIQVLEALLRLRQAACHPGLIDPSRAGQPSAKLETLFPELESVIAGGHKALVFSQFTSFLAIVRGRLDELGITYCYLDGSSRDREAEVQRFQNDPEVKLFLISLKAGGVGLNLTAADYVFLLDPWWNPAAEAQAIDRAHRIGQDRHVFAYRLVARDTVEEKILELQNSKRALADSIIAAEDSLIRRLDVEDLELLLG